jgi:hypothetical protein
MKNRKEKRVLVKKNRKGRGIAFWPKQENDPRPSLAEFPNWYVPLSFFSLTGGSHADVSGDDRLLP